MVPCNTLHHMKPGGLYINRPLVQAGMAILRALLIPSQLSVLIASVRRPTQLCLQAEQTLHICSRSVHRLLITSVLLAAKFLDDKFFNNAYYAKVTHWCQPMPCPSPLEFGL